ncbi:hypothetical protein C8P70_13119 [Myroides indicus]|uniref:Uncharacterized protein n=1 Tax=Myroides indicus TaxID=1323422 RepID=A0A4R7EWL4_9FLAO|nr:hypothetical protein C8P70_13119 [Myroides indicus]
MYISVKNMYISTKNMYISTKSMYISAKQVNGCFFKEEKVQTGEYLLGLDQIIF